MRSRFFDLLFFAHTLQSQLPSGTRARPAQRRCTSLLQLSQRTTTLRGSDVLFRQYAQNSSSAA